MFWQAMGDEKLLPQKTTVNLYVMKSFCTEEKCLSSVFQSNLNDVTYYVTGVSYLFIPYF